MLFSMKYRRVFAEGHSYFITMVTHRRQPFLIEHIDLLRRAFALSKQRYRYRIDAIVILPDHLHMIITPERADTYPKIVSAIKRSFVYALERDVRSSAKLQVSASQYKRKHAGIWQERFYEHTIRNEKDMAEKLAYIQNNPIKHGFTDNHHVWKYVYP